MQLEYFETILNQYLSPDASESLKSLQGVLLEKATESSSEPNDTPKHRRRVTRGSDDMIADDRQGTVSPDELIVRDSLILYAKDENTLPRNQTQPCPV